MDLLQSVLNAGGGDAVSQLAQKFGLSESDVTAGISSLLPAIAGGVQGKMATPDGLNSLLSTLASGQHAKYADDPNAVNHPDAAADGTSALNDLIGGAGAHQQVAQQAAQQTGISSDTLMQMLPVVASLAMGAMGKQVSSGDMQNAGAAEQSNGLLGMVGPLLGGGNSSPLASEVVGLASKFFTKSN
jgi:hypothetical protein